jgi:DNA/RNA-binding domain of Phe-tRNA-synthetase-like protein
MRSVPTAAYDLARVDGGLWLRPARGHESFDAGQGPEGPPINELVLTDGADHVLARRWHGSIGNDFRPAEGTGAVQVHVDVLADDGDPVALAEQLANELSRLAAGFLGCEIAAMVLHRGQPAVRWE